jgi:hypothetical protein
MTDINYLNGGGTHARPSTAFTADGRVLVDTPGEFAINNPHAGPTQRYSIHLYSLTNDFTYNTSGAKPVPTGGTITDVKIEDAHGNVYADFTDFNIVFSDISLADFWSNLQHSGPKAALNQLVGSFTSLMGSDGADQAETYGDNGSYQLGAGNDTFDIWNNFTQAAGEAGNDTFRIDQGGLSGLDLHGGLFNGTVASGEVNTINFHAAGTLAFDFIDGFTSFKFSSPGASPQYIYLTTDQLPGGTMPVFHLTGSAADHANEIVVEPAGGGAQYVDLRQVKLTDFTRSNQAFVFDFGSDTSNDIVIGAPGARNVFEFGSGADSAIGGKLNDVFTGGPGDDFFNGRGGINIANFDGKVGQYSLTKLAAHEYEVQDNRPGSPDGTDTLVNVQYLRFANATVFIGGRTPVVTATATSALHPHDLSAASAHHFDLFA